MNGNNLLLDSNIVLYLLNGEQTLVPLLEEKKLYVSFITQLEALGYKGITTIEQKKINQFLLECIIIDINPVIKNFTISLRQQYGLKLPDTIIMATSLYLNIPLITADKEYKKVESLDLIFYEK
jgi:predicted nucleic acid-binding protein